MWNRVYLVVLECHNPYLNKTVFKISSGHSSLKSLKLLWNRLYKVLFPKNFIFEEIISRKSIVDPNSSYIKAVITSVTF